MTCSGVTISHAPACAGCDEGPTGARALGAQVATTPPVRHRRCLHGLWREVGFSERPECLQGENGEPGPARSPGLRSGQHSRRL